ncbi:MAG: FkbM family methyltransferase [Actinomycetota bacterium]
MNVVYDLLGFQSRDHGERGIARYVLQLALALERTHPGLVTDYLVHPDLPFPAGAEPLVATGRLTRADRRSTGRWASDGGVFIAGSPFECFNQPSELVVPGAVRTNRWRRLVVLHDLIPAIFPELYLEGPMNPQYYGARFASLNLFDRFLVNSQATADDALEMLDIEPAQIDVIGAGADPRFRPPEDGPRVAASTLAESGIVPGLTPGYVLFPTGIDPRKNIERTIRAYGRLPRNLRDRHQLVLCCRVSDEDRAVVEGIAREAGLDGELLITGYVSDDTLCRLYQGAHLVVFPSYYEGFGLPALEAMRCGAPVICADATSLVEVQPLPEARFDPLSIRAITAALTGALTDEGFRDQLRDQVPPPFTWERSGELTGRVIAEELAALQARDHAIDLTTSPASGATTASGMAAPVNRPRLALFAPLPPQQTGVAAYAYRLVERLQDHCDVTVFVDCDATNPDDRPSVGWPVGEADLEPAALRRPDGVTVLPADRFAAVAASGGAFDQVLYLLGNSHHHVAALRTNELRPGHVLLHDVQLTELHRALRRSHPDRLVEGSVGRTIAHRYPGRYRAEVEAMDEVSAETADRFGILMARDIVDPDCQLLVHSEYARTLLHLDGAGGATVPFPMPGPEVDVAWRPDQPLPVITAFGPLDDDRQPAKLVTAMSTVVGMLPEARLRFVGRIEGEAKHRLLDVADRFGIGDRLEFHGDLDDDRFRARMYDTSLAVQLCARAAGESSATVAELLAVGVPVLTTDLGPATELPDDAVARIAVDADAEQLGSAIVDLLVDQDRRQAMSMAARIHAAANGFEAAAARLAELLFTAPADRGPADRSRVLDQLRQGIDHTRANLEVVRNASSAYLGDNLLVTRLETGQDIYVDGRDTSLAPALLLDGRWEPEATAVFTALLEPSSCVIDVGANVGYFGLVAGTVVDHRAGGSIHLLEANPHLAGLIERSVALNRLGATASVAAVAVSDGPGSLQLQIPKHLWGSSHLGELDDDLAGAIDAAMDLELGNEDVLSVPTVALDDYVEAQGLDRIDLIKMDIEGHEEAAYRGMKRLVARNRGRLRLLMEFSAGQYYDPRAFLDRVRRDFGSLAAIHPATGRLLPVASLDDLLLLSRGGFAMILAGHRLAGTPIRPTVEEAVAQ